MVSLTEDEEGALVAGLRNLTSSDTTESSWDGVFFATGYDFTKGVALLDEIRDKLLFDASGMPKMQRDYSVQSKAEFAPKVFVFGPTEQTHGLTSVLLSILPHRAEDLFNSINAPREGLVYSHG
jgi:lysine/ornithine N-monooxygenase